MPDPQTADFNDQGGVHHPEIFGDHLEPIAKKMADMSGIDPDEDNGKWLAWQEMLGNLLISLDAAYELGYELRKKP